MRVVRRDSAASAAQARDLDAAAIQHGVTMDALMALAGFQCARLAARLLDALPGNPALAVLAGRGNNGADALGCSRHLATWGRPVRAITLADGTDPETSYSRQARAAVANGVEVQGAVKGTAAAFEWALQGAGLIVDGLLGTGSKGPPRGGMADAIRIVNSASVTVLAIDLPSGLDPTTGEVYGDCVRADATLMLAIAKIGCVFPDSRPFVGRLWLADIGVPAAAYQAVGLAPPRFAGDGLGPYESA